MTTQTTAKMAGDLMCGAETIAAFLGWPVRRVFYACETRQIPAFKILNKWCARRSTLTAHIARLEQGGVQAAANYDEAVS